MFFFPGSAEIIIFAGIMVFSGKPATSLCLSGTQLSM